MMYNFLSVIPAELRHRKFCKKRELGNRYQTSLTFRRLPLSFTKINRVVKIFFIDRDILQSRRRDLDPRPADYKSAAQPG
jgi:hypothetical protein